MSNYSKNSESSKGYSGYSDDLSDIWSAVSERLQQDYDLKIQGEYLMGGKCPSCHKKTLWAAYPNQPGKIECNRLTKCRYEATAKELYPDLFDPKRLLKSHPATPTNRNATADAYLRQIRGFDTDKCKGMYHQESYSFLPTDADEGAVAELVTAVRFPLPAPMVGFWDRPLDGNHFGKKTWLVGGSKLNKWMWTPKNQELNNKDRLYITEGIFDALALVHSGKKAAAVMGVSNTPDEFVREFSELNLRYVIALDNDAAGKKHSKRLVNWLSEQGEEAECIQPSDLKSEKKVDWNDLWKQKKLNSFAFEKYKYWGQLLVARSPGEKALLMIEKEGWNNFPMTFNNKVFWIKYKAPQKEELQDDKKPTDILEVSQISTCSPEYLYFQKDIETRESVYYMRVTKPNSQRRYQEGISPSCLGGASEFDKQLMACGSGLMWTGNTSQLKRYLQHYWFAENEPNEVDCVSFLGYAKEFKTYIYKDYAIHKGQLLKANEFDYFELSNGKHVKTSLASDPIKLSENHYPERWLEDYKTAYGNKGLAALTSWFGSFFAEQIRFSSGSYPWTEMSGKAGTGKTSVLKFLWKLTGRNNYQGVELSKASIPGRWRSLEQSANLPIVLMEGDAGQGGSGNQKKGFNLEEAKGTFEGDGMRITALKTIGSETREPKFRGALWLAQNEQIIPHPDAGQDSGKAVMERIVHIHWDKSHFSPLGLEASQRLIDLNMEDINGFLVHCVKHEVLVLKRLRILQRAWIKHLRDDYKLLSNDRIRFNHSQMLALAMIMVEIGAVPLSSDELSSLQVFIIERALERQSMIEYDHPTLVEFWDLYEHLCQQGTYRELGRNEKQLHGEEAVNNAKVGSGTIAINLNHMEEVATNAGHRMPLKTELRKLLPNSKRHKFVGYKVTRNAVTGKVRKCFCFEAQ